MSEAEARATAVREHLAARRDEMVDMLVELAAIESPTDDPDAQRPVQEKLSAALADLDFAVRVVPGDKPGGLIFARPRARERGRAAQLLMGHSDTVWPHGTVQTMPVAVEDGVVRGPGTFDMKAGLVQGIFALRALRELGCEPPLTPVWFINSDEEVGSPESKRFVEMVARRVERTFVLEPALGPGGDLKTARKGVGRYRVRVVGKAAHSGLDPTGGRSAIEELAVVIRRLHALTDLERGLTVNVGVISGGTRPNVIAAEAKAQVDVRFLTMDDAVAIDEAIHAIEAETPGTSVEMEGRIETPPLERTPRNRALWKAAQDAAERLGFPLAEQISGGGSDGNTTSQYTATLDGLGPVGDGAHAHHEHVVTEHLPKRAALLAELLMHPSLKDK